MALEREEIRKGSRKQIVKGLMNDTNNCGLYSDTESLWNFYRQVATFAL